MSNKIEKLKCLGFDDWWQANVDAQKLELHEIARVVSVRKDGYIVTKGGADIFAELAGKLMYFANSANDLPTTGDWVYVDFYDAETHAIVHDVVPRKSLLQRKTSGKSIEFQSIAANVDLAFVMQSADYNFNLGRLERYLVMINESNITPIILLSKSDLRSREEIDELVATVVRIAPETTVIPFSNQDAVNINRIKELLLSGHTYCFLGSSGVGKTTLVNNLLGNELFETKSVSTKESKGRHTTTSRELIHINSGAILIDTPGMRELGNISVDAGIDETFSEIIELSVNCKFSNCKHIKEKGCAILLAVKEGHLSEKRYKNYIKIKKESSFNDMSYHEKRQRDKSFGKLIKSAVNAKHKR